MYPGKYAGEAPGRPAVIMARSGEIVTYRQLEDRSNQLAQYWYQAGLRAGDHVAILAENHPRYHEVYWAALRSGLYLTAVNRYLSAEEAAYIVDDCGAAAIVTTKAMADIAVALLDDAPDCEIRLMLDGVAEGYESYEDAVAAMPTAPLDEQPAGEIMLYSSGTTGRPKGIKRQLSGASIEDGGNLISGLLQVLWQIDESAVYLSPAPLYHSAPLAYTAGIQALGGTVVVMEKFDPLEFLQLVERYEVTITQLVPTMFVRMLKLDEAERTGPDLSTMKVVIHAAAPCPVEVKRQMIAWWGPVIYEYYAGTEANGFTFITSDEWLEHAGSVGKAIVGEIHICDDEGNELPAGEAGTVYFGRDDQVFEYHGDPEKTKAAQHPEHPTWTALGDVGYVDDEGYLYLTDRKAFMIISGGVNIYPQEIEDCLILHPKVADVAVFGLPDPEMGEYVHAVVQPAPGVLGDDALAAELAAFARDHVANYKVPRTIDFLPELPRLPTGKLYKRLLRDDYLAATGD